MNRSRDAIPGIVFGMANRAQPMRRSAFLMNPVLKLLIEGGYLTTAQMAQVAGMPEAEINKHLEQLKRDRIFLGWRPVLDLSRAESAAAVRAVIEVKITPERGGGFNRLAERLSRFDEVESCYLMSGAYDLLIFVNGPSLQKVAGVRLREALDARGRALHEHPLHAALLQGGRPS